MNKAASHLATSSAEYEHCTCHAASPKLFDLETDAIEKIDVVRDLLTSGTER